MKKQTFKFPVKLIAIILVILLCVLFVVGYIWNALMTSEYFKVREVIVSEGDPGSLAYLKGKNIFSIDLKKEAHSISLLNPDCQRIELIRNLPDRIIVKFNRRASVAQVKLYKYFLIDNEGVLLNVTGSIQEANLPVIVGLETKIFGPKAGRVYASRELALAMTIIRELKSNKFLKGYRISRIEVGSLQNASFFIPFVLPQAGKATVQLSAAAVPVEVKIGADNIRNKLMILAGIFLQSRNDIYNIKYVDLRFKDPVIKLKDAK